MVVSLLKGIRYNMEILDIYDEHGNLTGRTAERSTFLSKGEYFLCAHVILENQDGLFLVQKRSDTKATRPGQWDITAGAVDAGETSLDGALREAKEEIGLTLPERKCAFCSGTAGAAATMMCTISRRTLLCRTAPCRNRRFRHWIW